jgi:hypothetical protein
MGMCAYTEKQQQVRWHKETMEDQRHYLYVHPASCAVERSTFGGICGGAYDERVPSLPMEGAW